MTESTLYSRVARLSADIAGLAQGDRRASRNRSLLSSLQQDGHVRRVSRERIQRRSKHALLSVPDAERAELPDDIEFPERPSRVLSAPDRSDCLRQVSGEVHIVPRAILALRYRHRELSTDNFDADRDSIEGLGDGSQDAALIGSRKATASIDHHLRRKCGG